MSKNYYPFQKKNKEKDTTMFDLTKRTIKGAGYDDTTNKNDENENNNPVKENAIGEDDKIREFKDDKIQSVKNINKPTIQESVNFNIDDIPDYIQYDILPLPSNGECYASKKGRIPVRYLTASDENIIASPNMYTNGQLIDVILKRCILDKDFNVDEMCTGDRDAILIWLRGTSYGPEYPITATNSENGKQYDTVINLNEFKYLPFKLKGDENGWFDYTTSDGKVIKFKYLSKNDIMDVYDETIGGYVNRSKINIYKNMNEVKRSLKSVEDKVDDFDDTLYEATDYIIEWVGDKSIDVDENEMFNKIVTGNMIKYTMSVDGNTDREYITKYIENMRAMEAKKYREYVLENKPGVDMSVEIPIPESDGGGSFKTFLALDDTVFINTAK